MWFDIDRRREGRKSILWELIKTNVLWFTREEIMDEKLNMILQCNTVTKRQMLYWIALIDISCKTSKALFQQQQFWALLVRPKLEKHCTLGPKCCRKSCVGFAGEQKQTQRKINTLRYINRLIDWQTIKHKVKKNRTSFERSRWTKSMLKSKPKPDKGRHNYCKTKCIKGTRFKKKIGTHCFYQTVVEPTTNGF